MGQIHIITHRGLEPSADDFPSESSYEAFNNHLNRGYGIEFDAGLSKDGKIPIFHDAGLERITKGQDKRLFVDMTSEEIKAARLGKGDRLCFLDELLNMIARGNPDSVSALHLKGGFQEPAFLDILISYLRNAGEALSRMIIFDVKIETAKYLKSKMPELDLAPSVAHAYDIQRYNQAVKGTLLSVEEVLVNRDFFSWVWLDEWDLADENSGAKKFYTAETFRALKNNGLKIALVTPELHGTSPGLLGGEAHPDAIKERLFNRIQEIISLKPDAVCTDYPEEVKAMV
jgi:glycerophosphoryl diester phosphodiesterase